MYAVLVVLVVILALIFIGVVLAQDSKGGFCPHALIILRRVLATSAL